MNINLPYMPAPYRAPLLPQVLYWGLVAVVCVAVVLCGVLDVWVLDALHHGP